MIMSTEAPSRYNMLENMSVMEIMTHINVEDQTVAQAVHKVLPAVVSLVSAIVPRMKKGGRLFYIGAGTSGRLGVLDASECPPTFGVSDKVIIGLIAGGDTAIRTAVESAEDNKERAWKELSAFGSNDNDSIIGLAASGMTPYVIGGLKTAGSNGWLTGCVVCNSGTPVAAVAEYPVAIETGPEFLTGSTRMKAGTAQKMVLNMISTAVMIQLGHVRGNLMVDMKLSNAKLRNRAVSMVVQQLGIPPEQAKALIAKYGNVRNVLDAIKIEMI